MEILINPPRRNPAADGRVLSALSSGVLTLSSAVVTNLVSRSDCLQTQQCAPTNKLPARTSFEMTPESRREVTWGRSERAADRCIDFQSACTAPHVTVRLAACLAAHAPRSRTSGKMSRYDIECSSRSPGGGREPAMQTGVARFVPWSLTGADVCAYAVFCRNVVRSEEERTERKRAWLQTLHGNRVLAYRVMRVRILRS